MKPKVRLTFEFDGIDDYMSYKKEQNLMEGIRFDGEKYHIEINKNIKQILSALPPNKWYPVIWDSDGDFLITNMENKKYLIDVFFKLKELKKENS